MKVILMIALLLQPVSEASFFKHKREKESFFAYIIRILIKPSIPHDGEGDT
ncbi:hypothetical protein [Halobacteriovorax sp. CON-3]|uniref:hypothetical protein n=1 Tax=Halobacteriovorax sp. CON-3 TaxID=3157710 RepID=UPI00371758CA